MFHKNLLCFVFLVLLLLGSSESLLTAVATPSQLNIGLSNSLDVRCYYQPSNGSPSALVSLIIGRSNNGTAFDDLASVNVFSGQKVFTTEGVTATSAINNNGESYLNLHWDFPGEFASGNYECSAQGPDDVGHNIVITNTTSVSYSKPDQDVLLVKIREMDALLKRLQDTISELRNNNSAEDIRLAADIYNVEQCCIANTKKTDDILLLDNVSDNTYRALLWNLQPQFISYNLNNKYLISKGIFQSVQDAEKLCNAFNSHLVEINSPEEYNLVSSWLQNTTDVNYVYTGVTKVGDQWMYRHSSRPVDYFNWADSEPKTGAENDCMFMEVSMNWQMTSYKCASPSPIHALCEVE
uniref:C-type lectin domain-containing protein n=1 Tax=Biomphalaria glabrata TaxID=6526 RepID=A0A2C9L4E2_BIOGL